MRLFQLRCLLLAVPLVSAFAQAPALQMNVVYVCTDGQSFKVFSCDNTTGACDYQNYKKGQAYQRGEALRVQLVALLPAKCHAQTPAEAQADPHRGEIPPAPSPFKARANSGNTGSGSAAVVNSQAGAGGFGNPLLRDPSQVREDFIDGKISAAFAEQHYAVLFGPRGALDVERTARLRSTRMSTPEPSDARHGA